MGFLSGVLRLMFYLPISLFALNVLWDSLTRISTWSKIAVHPYLHDSLIVTVGFAYFLIMLGVIAALNITFDVASNLLPLLLRRKKIE